MNIAAGNMRLIKLESSPQVLDMNELSINHGPSDDRLPIDRPILHPVRRNCSVMSTKSEQISVNEPYGCIFRVAYRRSVLRNGIKHRLKIRRRASDHPQDFACRRLLLQRLLEFTEESHVLNRDDGLVREGFEKLDLRRRER